MGEEKERETEAVRGQENAISSLDVIAGLSRISQRDSQAVGGLDEGRR